MKHIWSLLCRKSVVDPDNNLLNISEALEELTVNLPAFEKSKRVNIPMEFELTSYWIKEENDKKQYQGLLQIYDPSNEKLGEFEFDLIFKGSFRRLRTRLKISGLVLTVSGEYKFKVMYVDGKKNTYVAEIPLFVTINPISNPSKHSL
jgi:hypothetical protein